MRKCKFLCLGIYKSSVLILQRLISAKCISVQDVTYNNILYCYIKLKEIACTVEPVYYGHLGANRKCPDYQG